MILQSLFSLLKDLQSVRVEEQKEIEAVPQLVEEAKVSFEKAVENKLVFEDLEPATVVSPKQPKETKTSVELIKEGILGMINPDNLKPVEPNA